MDVPDIICFEKPQNNVSYIESYSDLNVHSLLLRDEPRIHAYRRAIFADTNFWSDKVVLDVGAGTGILSLYCAKAGAKKVFAVESNERVSEIMKNVIKENDCEHTIEVVQCSIEEATLPCKVDVIVSEWMGYYLLHEAMLDSVLFARSKYLKEGGLMFPEVCEFYVSPCMLPQYFDTWSDITGLKMESFGRELRTSASKSPQVVTIPESCVLSLSSKSVFRFDLSTITIEEVQDIKFNYHAVIDRVGKFQGLCLWFDVIFPSLNSNAECVILSTSLKSVPTHWKQTVIVFMDDYEVEPGDTVGGSVQLKRVGNDRMYQITVEQFEDFYQHPEWCTCSQLKCRIISQFMKDHDTGNDKLKDE